MESVRKRVVEIYHVDVSSATSTVYAFNLTCCAVGLAVLLALRRFASGFSDRETLDSASAHRFEKDLNGQWEGIFAVRSRPAAILDASLTSQRHHPATA